MTTREGGGGVLAIGPLPPPVHGYSLITARVVERLQRITTVEVLDLSPGTMVRGWRYHATRAGRVARALWRLARRQAHGRTLYLAIAGGTGVFYDLAFVLAARWRRYRIVIHHNAFSYLNRRSAGTAALIALAGGETLHICLCPMMARRLAEQYPTAVKRLVLSNAALVPPLPAPPSRPARSGIRLGFLSNLMPEKGLDTAITVTATLRERGAAVSLVVAGPTVDRSGERLLEDAKMRLGDALDYRGAVHGPAKMAFFADVDVLLFPSRYANEAQPLVVLEAMAHGVPVVAAARGCIEGDIGRAGLAVPSAGNFVEISVDAISNWLADPSQLAFLVAASRGRAADQHNASASELDRVISAIAETSPDASGARPS
ncbi:MAG TPA: glycosyltransferase family 4 protein [Stellaceae bacterium]|nr:glycosyltransferase family 4 protein [Stellaceae bacterium]